MRANLGCGAVFIDSNEWLNFDFDSNTVAVREVDLTQRLPLGDSALELVYSSHVIEHFDRSTAELFVSECFRLLAPGGYLRIVTPDFKNVVDRYTEHLTSGKQNLAEVEILLLFDQFTRRSEGGEYRRLLSECLLNNDIELAEYIYDRTGEHPFYDKNKFVNPKLQSCRNSEKRPFLTRKLKKIRKQLVQTFVSRLVRLLPESFRTNNILMTKPGEKHLWIYDFSSLRNLLESSGFTTVRLMTHSSTEFTDPSILCLDVDSNGRPRKGSQSMFVEARKPAVVA